MPKRFGLPTQLTNQWYFFPIVGVILILFINGSIFGVLALRKANQSASTNKTNDPSPTPEVTSTIEATPTPAPTATSRPSPSPTTKPKTTTTPNPTVQPSPSPTPYEKEDIRILSPNHQQNYDGSSIEISMEPMVNGEIEKLEFVVDGQVKQSFTQSPYKKTIDLNPGSYELFGKVTLKDGTTITSGTLLFGIGGVKWNEPDPTATPTPSPTASPSPTP